MSLLTQEDKIFKNRSVLSTKNYIPDKLLGREDEIEYVEELVEPILSGAEPLSSFITGLTGIGKTAVVKYVLNILNEVVKDVRLFTIVITCESSNTEIKILNDILDIIHPTHGLPRTGLPANAYYHKFWEVLQQERTAIVIVLDEINNMKNPSILYSLSRCCQFVDNPSDVMIGTICITNDMHYFDKLDPRIISSIGRRNHVFKPYNAVQIADILTARAELAFKDNVLDEAVIPMCAAYAAREHGDARMAIQLLYEAGMLAKKDGRDYVNEDDVKHANIKLSDDTLSDIVTTLPYHNKIVLFAILQLENELHHEKVTTGLVEARYKDLCLVISTDALTRTSISKIISKLEMAGLITTRLYTKDHGTTRIISIYPQYKEKIVDIFCEDLTFSGIPNYVPFSYQQKFL